MPERRAFEWWPLYVRGLAVVLGLSVQLIGTQAEPAVPSPTVLLLLFLLLSTGVLSALAPFRPLVDYVRCHQEAYDGRGYPQGLVGEAIPLGARIIPSPTRSTP